MKQHKKIRVRWTYLVILILLVAIMLMTAQMIRLSRRVQFSKNIYLSNEYLLSSYITDSDGSSDDLGIDEIPPISFGEWWDASNEDIAVNTVTLMKEWNQEQYDSVVQLSELLQIPLEELALMPKEERIRLAKEKIIDVPYLTQEGSLPNGCEAVSAVMLLQNMGVSITPEDFVDQYLSKEEIKVKWGCRYGPNPAKAYAGDPRSEKNGFGCFAPVITAALRNTLNELGKTDLAVQNISGMSLNEIKYWYINNGIPVAVWLTNEMKPLDGFYQWQSYDKSETYLYPIAEHCLVLIGYDEDVYYFNDPLDSRGIVSYPHELVSTRYSELGKQAVVLIEK